MEEIQNLYKTYNDQGIMITSIFFILSVLMNIVSIFFTTRTQEIIKSELSVKTKAQQAIYDDERKAIIDFLTTAFELKMKHIVLPFALMSKATEHEFNDHYQEQIKILENYYDHYLVISTKLKLMCFDEIIISKSKELDSSLAVLTKRTIATGRNLGFIYLQSYKELKKVGEINNDLRAKQKEINKIADDHFEHIEKEESKFNINYNIILAIAKDYLKERHNIK